jgi:hypothetical protein
MLELRFANEHVALVVTFPLFFAIEHDIPIHSLIDTDRYGDCEKIFDLMTRTRHDVSYHTTPSMIR